MRHGHGCFHRGRVPAEEPKTYLRVGRWGIAPTKETTDAREQERFPPGARLDHRSAGPRGDPQHRARARAQAPRRFHQAAELTAFAFDAAFDPRTAKAGILLFAASACRG